LPRQSSLFIVCSPARSVEKSKKREGIGGSCFSWPLMKYASRRHDPYARREGKGMVEEGRYPIASGLREGREGELLRVSRSDPGEGPRVQRNGSRAGRVEALIVPPSLPPPNTSRPHSRCHPSPTARPPPRPPPWPPPR